MMLADDYFGFFGDDSVEGLVLAVFFGVIYAVRVFSRRFSLRQSFARPASRTEAQGEGEEQYTATKG